MEQTRPTQTRPVEKNNGPTLAWLTHPFVTILAAIVIAGAGYAFGQWLRG